MLAEDRVAQTLTAMRQGADVIYQAALLPAPWHGFADFLHRNVQVNYLRRTLPEGARVGTVDMFQGQEAEVVLISMVTSSGGDLPRHIEFLYSKNRLNVAISRARTLAVLVASPQLLEIACQTIDQMRLVNTLCWVKAYAASLRP